MLTDVELNAVLLSNVMLSVIMLSAVMLSAVAPVDSDSDSEWHYETIT
jgi:hypothetical protein